MIGAPRLPMRVLGMLGAALLMAVTGARASTITIVNLDGANEGFNDATPVSPVGGNTGTTLGQQRLIAFQFAADVWASRLYSDVEIRVEAQFSSMFCSSGSAILGGAGAIEVFRDFAGAPRAATWYPVALANSLAGVDLDPAGNDISAEFNSDIDHQCLSGIDGWYYGLDHSAPSGQLDFAETLLHELAHGLGFSDFVSLSTGQKFFGYDDVYMLNLEDHTSGKLYPDMTDAERVAASKDTGNLHWVGDNVVAAAGFLSSGREPISGHVEMYAPNPQEPGSSVAHFDTSLTPDELMEPYLTPTFSDVLTQALLSDIGWGACGNSLINPGEACDDGNLVDGDGCSHTCAVEQCFSCAGEPSVCTPLAPGAPCDDGNACTDPDTCSAGVCSGVPDDGAPCDDGNQCTTPDVCLSGACDGTPDNGAPCDDGDPCTDTDTCQGAVCSGSFPLSSCLSPDVPGKSLLVLKDKLPDKKDHLVWKWLKGTTDPALFGDPTVATSYDLCIYDSADGTLMRNHIPAGPMWRSISNGFKYVDRYTTSDGIHSVLLRGGSTGKAKIVVIGKGSGLDMTPLGAPLDLPVTVQITNGSTCWQAAYGSPIQDRSDLFKAKGN